MSATYKEWYIQLIDGRTGKPIDDDTGKYTVLTLSSPVPLTVYSDGKGTALTLPATMTDGVMNFFTASTVASLDLSVLTGNGHAFFLEAVVQSNGRIIVWPENIDQQLIVPYNCNTACNVVVNTGFTLPLQAFVKDCFLHVTTAATAGPLDVGNSTDTDGYLDAAIVSVTGYKVHDFPVTGGTQDTYISATQIRGALLRQFDPGVVTDTGGGVDGFFEKKTYRVTDATSGGSLTYVVTATNSGGTGSGYIYVTFDRIPTAGN